MPMDEEMTNVLLTGSSAPRGGRGPLTGRRLAVLLGLLASIVLWPSAASAHPLGTFTVSRYSGIVVVRGELRIGYVVHLAEVPTLQLFPEIDTDRDEQASAAELSAWAEAEGPRVVGKLTLEVDGRPVAIQIRATRAQLLLNSDDGFSTLRFEGDFVAPLFGQGSFSYVDANGNGESGWHEITAVGRQGVRLSDSTAPMKSVSDALHVYPPDLLTNQPNLTSMTASFTGAGAASATPPPPSESPFPSVAPGPVGRPGGTDSGALASLLQNEGFPLLFLAVLIAIALGAWHALLPGHGKTLTAAYMVGSQGNVRQAVAVGSAIAVMHTASVLGLGLLVLTLEHTFRPERLYPWLGLASGMVALGLGAYLLISRLSVWASLRRETEERSRRRPRGRSRHGANARGHRHDDHVHDVPERHPLSPRSLLALALAGGILPAPSALLVMLGAINTHRAVYGVALVLAFSAGLAVALIVVALGALRARDAVATRLSSRLGRLVPVLSASAIVGVGIFLTIRGVTQVLA
jgi:nickel/cobalt transporter (NicO) family protein